MDTEPADAPEPLLDAAEVEEHLAAANPAHGWTVEVAGETDSTNAHLLREAAAGVGGGKVLFAERQSAGRGRRGRQWLSPGGRNLLFSFLLRPGTPPEAWGRFTLATGLGVCRALESHLGLRPLIKWPNDIFFQARKACGILAESRAGPDPCVVIGVGLNVNLWEDQIPAPVRETATSLLIVHGTVIRRAPLAAALLREIGTCCRACEEGEFPRLAAAIEDRSLLSGREVTVVSETETFSGTAGSINAEGELLVDPGDGRPRSVRSGEVLRVR